MEYAIFPMKTISISQGYSSAHKAFDCNGSSGDRATKNYWYAPYTLKILKLLDKKIPAIIIQFYLELVMKKEIKLLLCVKTVLPEY